MQTLFNFVSNKRLHHAGRLGLITLLVLATLVTALPQSALAASCATYYTVKSGDTRSQVAHIYGMPWKDIAKANHLTSDARLKVGQKLCIPSQNAPVASTGTMRARINGDAVIVTMSNFPERAIWYVNGNDTQGYVNGVYKIGRMKVPANTTISKSFRLPLALRNTTYITVCVKNVVKFDKICQQVYHPVK
jgi:hypothetical protein